MEGRVHRLLEVMIQAAQNSFKTMNESVDGHLVDEEREEKGKRVHD